jgi:L-threonylcarbamoyladenylate synthase
MRIIKQQDLNINEIVEKLKDGKTVVYPTETCYGLGCDATNQAAVNKVFKIKQRQKDKPLLVVVPDEEMAMKYIEWSDTIEQLAQKYWPGPLTIVASTKPNCGLATGVLAEDESAAFRVIDHPVAHELSSALGLPLISTSANISSHQSPYSIEKVLAMFDSHAYQPDLVIDAGDLINKNISTIVKIEGGVFQVLRQGGLVVKL